MGEGDGGNHDHEGGNHLVSMENDGGEVYLGGMFKYVGTFGPFNLFDLFNLFDIFYLFNLGMAPRKKGGQ